MEIKIGSTVILKSGGAEMTVVELDEANGQRIATCVWHNKQHKEERGTYPLDALSIHDGPTIA